MKKTKDGVKNRRIKGKKNHENKKVMNNVNQKNKKILLSWLKQSQMSTVT